MTDPFGGQADLRDRIVRAVGNARERFDEDGLRIMRAARFVATLDFCLEPTTRQAMIDSIQRLRYVSSERIRDEILKTLDAPQPSSGLQVMQETGVFAEVVPELLPLVGCEQNRHHTYDVWTHTLHSVDACPPDEIVRLAVLLHDVGKPSSRAMSDKTQDYTFYHHENKGAKIADRVCDRLRLSTQQRLRVRHLVRHHLIPYDDGWSDAAVRRWVRRVQPEHVQDLLTIARADAMGKGVDATSTLDALSELERRVESIQAQGMATTVRDLSVNGRDLMQELDLTPGPILGQVLAHLLERVTDAPELNERTLLLTEAKRFVQSSGSSSTMK